MSIMSDLILVGVSGFFLGAAIAFEQFTKNKIPQQKIMKKKLNLKLNWQRFTFVVVCLLISLFVILRAPQIIDAKEILEFNRDVKNYNVKLQIIDSENKKLAEFLVAIADDENKKMYGLMNLSKLPDDHGMLFPFFQSKVVLMWMKNTRIPLDMIFIDSNNVIAHIKTNAEAYSTDFISSEKEVNKVLEVNAYSVKKFGIKVGQKIRIEN